MMERIHTNALSKLVAAMAVLALSALLCAPAAAQAVADEGDSGAVSAANEAQDLTMAPLASTSSSQVAMYRLYNPNSGEHFYTSNTSERNKVRNAGWEYEGVGWYAPSSGTKVFRVYNRYGGEHHYTTNKAERDMLVKAGWNDEGVGWYSDKNKAVKVYREYNPNQYSCNHNYTADKSEHNNLVKLGWRDEGTAWYACKVGADSVIKSYNGWYQSIGNSGMYYYHLVDGVCYYYKRDLFNSTMFTFLGKFAVSVKAFSKNQYSAIGSESGHVLTIGAATYFERDSNKGMLESRKSNGSGYSASSSMGKITNVPSQLKTLANKTES